MKKIFSSKGRNNSDWTEKIVESSQQKTASIKVVAGTVKCPMTGKTQSTLNCELCNHCSGSNIKVASSEEFIHCQYKYNNREVKEFDTMDKFISTANKQDLENISQEDFKSVFAREQKENDFVEEEILSQQKVVSSGNDVSSKLATGPQGYIPEWNNSIFDSDALDKFAEKEIAKEAEAQESKRKIEAEKAEKKANWDADYAEKLREIGYEPSNSIKSIAHESVPTNPDVSDHKFSIFDNIDEKLASIPSHTQGEKFASQAEERKEKIARKKEEDNSWEEVKKGTSTSKIMDSFIDTLLSKKED